MSINIIVAVSKNNIIGKNGKMPWILPEDLKRFKKITMGHIIVMGRKTYESIGHPLKGRTNIILTSKKDYRKKNCIIYNEIKKLLEDYKKKEIYIIGGEKIYKSFEKYTNYIYMTYIDKFIKGDRHFIDYKDRWEEIERSKKMTSEKNINYYFIKLKRTGGEINE